MFIILIGDICLEDNKEEHIYIGGRYIFLTYITHNGTYDHTTLHGKPFLR